jgi:hypothetical protein
MKSRVLVLLGSTALAVAAIYFWPNEGRQPLVGGAGPGDTEATGGLKGGAIALEEPRQPLGLDGADLLRTDPEDYGPAAANDTWLPMTPDQSLAGFTTSRVLEVYWGSRWGEIQAELKNSGMRLYEHDTWEWESWRRLGDPEKSLEALKLALIDKCTPEELIGFNGLGQNYQPQAIHSLEDVRGSIQRELNRHAVELQVPNAILTQAQIKASEARIKALAEPRQQVLYELARTIREVVAADLEPVTVRVQPSLGTLMVSASLAWTPKSVRDRQRQNPSRWWVVLSATAGSNSSYVGSYHLLLTDHPQCANLIEQLVASEQLLESSLDLERQWWRDNCQVMDH